MPAPPPSTPDSPEYSRPGPGATPRFGPVKTIVYSLIPLLALALAVELTFRVREFFYPPLRADYGLGFDESSRVFRERGGQIVTRPAKRVSFVSESFARTKPVNECRVFMIGGSNVNYLHHLFPEYENRLTEMLEGACEVNLINVGGLAYGSQRLLRIAFELMDYEPDLLLIYAGHNEFEELEQLSMVELDNIPVQRVIYRSAVMRYFRDRAVMNELDRIQLERNRRILGQPAVDYMATAGRVFTPEEIDDRMQRYRAHIERIITLYQEHDVPVIIGSVATNYWAPDLPWEKQEIRAEIDALYTEGDYAAGLARARAALRESSRHQASDAENEIIHALAAKHGLPLADVEAAIIAAEPNGVPGETLFSDRCHVTEDGKRILLDTFLPLVREQLRERLRANAA